MTSRRTLARPASALVAIILLATTAACGSESEGKGEAKSKSSPSAASSPSPTYTGPARTAGTPTKCLTDQEVSQAIGLAMTYLAGRPDQGVLKCTYIAPQKRALQLSLSTYVPEDAPGVFERVSKNFKEGLKIPGEDGGIGTKSLVFSQNPGIYLVLAYDDNGTVVISNFVAKDAAKYKAGMLKALDQVLAKY